MVTAVLPDSWRSVVGRVGGFFVMTLETFRSMVRRPFQVRELIEQAWFVVTVSLLPTFLIRPRE
jgi:phospholipid/cholesterol/gamma-HCH transport system permease protein